MPLRPSGPLDGPTTAPTENHPLHDGEGDGDR